MGEEEKEVYEIIASLPIDTGRMNVLSDITFEAQLLMRSKFLKKITLGYEDMLKINELGKDKEVLLTTELNNKRYIIYIDHGVIVSSAETDPDKGTRIVGLRPLATLILASKIKPLTFKLFEIQPYEEEKTREAPKTVYREFITKKKIVPTTIHAAEKKEPKIMEFSKMLKELIDKTKQDVEDLAPLYGCKLVDVKLAISRGIIYIRVYVKKKGFLGKCDIEKLKENIKNDLEVITSMIDLNLPYKVEVIQTK
ncbi:hypothetical protein [Staphylothermus hellenicus]|uniref:Uncharacterized protein n=1 Tax=Staphylothermus hellenicus (strain DSM 12710 / JCM 10830 / BK20S6-10-b1 / P8) TaxID=591019 RepID=D7D8J0_STAHD|nr:hypothetical protein [Staphylothermus hellenicus]ADI32086.1 hypothetical protein Shell_0980 [Staphylothermus hellenicus DSM 12710]